MATFKKALKGFVQDTFGLILPDIFMPYIQGYELIAQIKNLTPKTGIVTMTNYNTRELERQDRKQRGFSIT